MSSITIRNLRYCGQRYYNKNTFIDRSWSSLKMEKINRLYLNTFEIVENNKTNFAAYKAALMEIRETFRPLGGGSVRLDSSANKPLALLELDNPSKSNAFSGKMMAELADAVDSLESHDYIGGVLLCSALNSKVFCAGFDLSICQLGSPYMTSEFGYLMSLIMQDTLLRLQLLPAVTLAAISGHAIGGGAELATTCDFRSISSDANISFVQKRMGVVPGWGGHTRLLQLTPNKSVALHHLLTCEPITPELATRYSIGHVFNSTSNAIFREQSIELLKNYIYSQTTNFKSSCNLKTLTSNLTLGQLGGNYLLSDYWKQQTLERLEFSRLWGGPSHIDAVNNFKKKALNVL